MRCFQEIPWHGRHQRLCLVVVFCCNVLKPDPLLRSWRLGAHSSLSGSGTTDVGRRWGQTYDPMVSQAYHGVRPSHGRFWGAQMVVTFGRLEPMGQAI